MKRSKFSEAQIAFVLKQAEDAFGGSGSTLIAAEKTKRRGRLIELEPKYCEVTIRRWEKLAGREAVLDGDGRTFDQVRDSREANHAFDIELGQSEEEAV